MLRLGLSTLLVSPSLGPVLLAQPAGVQAPPPREKPIDLSGRRLAGRETLILEPGVTVHADVKIEAATGVIQLHGKIFLDASTQRPSRGKMTGWPRYAYAGSATWDPVKRRLTLSNAPVLEDVNSAVVSEAVSTIIILGYKSRMVLGRTANRQVEKKESTLKGPVL